MSCPKAKVIFEYYLKVPVLLDSEIQMNMMTRAVMKNDKLTMRSEPRLQIISYNEQISLFIDICENVTSVSKIS